MEKSGMRRFIPMIGNVYGQLTVIDRNPSYSNKNYHWNCKCTCGNIIACAGTRLRSGELVMCPTCVRTKTWEESNKATQVQLEIGGVEIPMSDPEKMQLTAYLVSLRKDHWARLNQLEQEHNALVKGMNSIDEEKKEIEEQLRNIGSAEKALKEVMGL